MVWSHLQRKTSHLNSLRYMIKIKKLDGSRIQQDMKTPLRSFSVYNTTTTQWSNQDVLAYIDGKCTPIGKGKDPSRIGCILGKNKILICMDFTYITYLYNLVFSKHLPAYSLTCLYCSILFLSYILVSKHEISSHKYILNIIINISFHHLSISKHT